MRFLSRTDNSLIGRWWWTVDRGTLGAVIAIMVFGVVLVAAASPPVAMRIGVGQYHFIIRHLVFLVPAVVILLSISFMDLRYVWRCSLLILVTGIVSMILVLVFGVEVKGAQRWINVLGFSLQPSEFVKPSFIVVCSWFIAKSKEEENFPGMKIALAIYAVVVALLVMQPDMGMTLVVTMCFMVLLFLAGVPLRLFFMLAGLVLVGMIVAYFALPHFKSRIDRFIDPSSGDTFQIEKSLEAFKNGGIGGTGPGQGVVKLGIPDAHSDFVFSVAGEELGIIGVVVIVGLYGFILVRGFNRVMDSDDMFVILGAGGLLAMFGLQSLVHMGSTLSIIPTKGMTLPFISYGGSSMLSTSVAMGMILALTRRQARSGIAKAGLSIRPIGGKSIRIGGRKSSRNG